MRVGFIGIGNMGWPMAANLVKKGFDLTVYDVQPERAASFSAQHGSRAAGALEELAASEAIITMLPTGPIVRQVLAGNGGDGLMRALRPGAIVIDMSSSEPIGTRELGQALAAKNIILIDAPVSGGVPRAVAGTLAIMIGSNDPAAVERIKPLLLAMGERLFETGTLGCGHAMKALNNYVAGATFAATSEALLIGRQFGLDQATMVEILNVSTGHSFHTNGLLQQHVLGRQFATGFTVGLLAKDVKTAADLSQGLALDAPLLRLVEERWAFARDVLGTARDHTEAILAWDQVLSRQTKADS
jgi:3-hydroxyisobutyrate dehydrogenase